LARRAICLREQQAWEIVFGQYQGFVLACIRRHPVASAVREDEDYLVNRAFQRLWSAVTPERFDQFAGLPALLKYLKMCAHSVLLDAARQQRGNPIEPLTDLTAEIAEPRTPEGVVMGRQAGRELWQVIAEELQDDAERKVAYLSFVRELKPREVYERAPDRFQSVADVYRIKRNVLDRLRRSPRIRDFLR
jgi:DNA-directed RNA polymerase specialized sigma24 family protein